MKKNRLVVVSNRQFLILFPRFDKQNLYSMRDLIVRQAFHRTVLKCYHEQQDTMVVDEMGLNNGLIRADIAVLNGKMVGYEIKTQRDSLKRLPGQIAAYSEVFDEAFVITSENHLKKVESMLPPWWGIYEIIDDGDHGYSFKCYRIPGENKDQKASTIVRLLWKEEALKIANELYSFELKPSSTKKEIFKKLCSTSQKEELCQLVINTIKQRGKWRANRLSLLQNDD